MVGPFLLFTIAIFYVSFSANAQDCGHVVCTSNDVRPVSAFLSGPGGAAIDCTLPHPFDNAELHLILTTNTPRVGVSISGYLKFDATDSVAISNCFTGVQLNANSPNDLIFSLGSLLHDATCTDNFSLSDIFIAWGTGNTDFCKGSQTAECPETPSKCRFKPGEIIAVTVKLDVDFSFTPGDCLDQTNLTVDFSPSITAQNITDPLSVHWDFGDGNTHDTTGVLQANIASAGVEHTYATANTYTVTLTITDATQPQAVTKTATHDITLDDCEQSCIPPSPCTDALTQCATPGTSPATAVFDLTKSTCNSQVNGGWFTDPGFLVADMIADPTSVTASDGTVVYGLIFDDCGDQVAATVTLHVNGLPNASAGSNSPVCAGSTLNLNSGPNNETSYSWTGPNSFSNATQNPSIPNVTAAAAGTYTVTVTDGNSCSATASTSVTVNALPTPTAGSNSPVCAGATLNLTSGPDNETSYSWTGPNSFSNGTQNPSIPNVTTDAAGTYTVTVTDGNSCSATASTTVTVNPTPTVDATPATQTVCSGAAITDIVITNPNNVAGTTFSWTRDQKSNLTGIAGTGTSSTISGTLTNITNTQITTTFTITATAGDCSSTTSVTVTVNPTPTASATPSSQSVCSGTAITSIVISNPNNVAGTTFSWTRDNTSNLTGIDASGTGSSISGTLTNTTSTQQTTTFTVTATAGDCSSTASASVTVNPIPSCDISNTTSSGSTSAGVGQPVSFSGPSAPAGSTYGYAWSFSSNTAGATFAGGASTATTQAVTVTTTGTGSYTLSLTVTDKTYTTNCHKTCTYTVTINTGNAYYTVTQGFYGNVGGKICTPSAQLYTAGSKGNAVGLISTSIQNMPGKQLKLGIIPVTPTTGTRTFIMGYSSAEEQNLISYLPATQTATLITSNTSTTNNNTNIGGLTPTSLNNLPKIYNKKISDVLLGQAITLDLNVYIPGNNLGGFVLQNGYLTTQKADISTCPATKVITCAKDATTISSLQIATSVGMQNWIASGKTVNDLLTLASNALGGASLPTGVSLTDINNAVNVINTSFDGGRFFIGYYTTQKSCSNLPTNTITSNIPTEPAAVDKATVSVYPNPFNDEVSFIIQSPVSGKATLEVFNMMGQKMRTVFNGQLFAGMAQTVEFNVPYTSRVNMIYMLKVNGQQVIGKLISMKQ